MNNPDRHAAADQNLGAGYTVYVDDNAHYMDPEARHVLGVFDSETEAVAAARQVVDASLQALFRPGKTAENLLGAYKAFGEDPWISPPASFSAWSYAQARCRELCRT